MLENLFNIFGSDFARQLTPPRSKPAADATRQGTAAVINLTGVLSRDGRFGGTSTDAVRRELSVAAADPTCSQIVLRVNSVGGLATGTADLHDAVVAAVKQKPVVAFVEDVCASAAFFAVCGASKIVAGRSALVGAIGTYAVALDASGLADRAGVKVHVIKAGEFKGMGEFGTAVSEKQLLEIQRVINSINAQFLSAVGAGRKLAGKQLDAVSTGQVWIAADAKAMGLIDEIGSLDSILSQSSASLLSRQWFAQQRQVRSPGIAAKNVAPSPTKLLNQKIDAALRARFK